MFKKGDHVQLIQRCSTPACVSEWVVRAAGKKQITLVSADGRNAKRAFYYHELGPDCLSELVPTGTNP